MFLCRKQELNKLNDRYKKSSFECVVIYGRRRVGKTALINEFVKDKPVIYFPALDANAQTNLAALSKSIAEYYHPGALSYPVYDSLEDAFAEITRIARTEGRRVFVIDEFPYLVKSDASVSSRLQHLIDHEWADTDLFLILCGSSMSFMEKEVLSEKSPLFGRRTAQLRIEPLDYRETAQFAPDLSVEEKALLYGITGGVPHYIRKLEPENGMREALIENFFDPSAYLFEEPSNLLKQELREPAVYNSMISAIASGASRMNEIAQKAGTESSVCTKYLHVLTELGIVHKMNPVIGGTQRKSVYRITDHFFRFWYRFVPENMSSISYGTIKRIYDTAISCRLSDYMELVFEDMCRQYLVKYCRKLPFEIGRIGEWWGSLPDKKKEAQLDVVAIAARDVNEPEHNSYIIGSCKYTNKQVDADELSLIQEYASAFAKPSDECYYYIFSKSGFTDKLREMEKSGAVQLITLEDMYKEI